MILAYFLLTSKSERARKGKLSGGHLLPRFLFPYCFSFTRSVGRSADRVQGKPLCG